MHFEEYLATTDPAKRERVDVRLAFLRGGPQICRQAERNLRLDPRFDNVLSATLADALEKTYPDLGAVVQAIRSVMQRHILTGPIVVVPDDTVFGRVVAEDLLARQMAKDRSVSVALMRRDLRRTVGRSISTIRVLWRHRPLGRHVMWATFDLASRDPFSHSFATSLDLRACMGLPRGDASPVIRMEYRLPNKSAPRFPRVVEAYAGKDWPYYFAPEPRNADWGKTLPWDVASALPAHNEVVHSPITGAHLDAIGRVT